MTCFDFTVSLAFTDEQEELRQVVRGFLEKKSPEAEVRRLMEDDAGYDRVVWMQMAEQLGLQSIIVPEDFGGSGFGFAELVVVLEEMGRALLCAPFFSTAVLATNALLLSGDEDAMKRYLPEIASGERIATVGLSEDAGTFDECGIETRATRSGGGFVLDGVKNFVIDGNVASLILVPARLDGEISLFAVSADSPGLVRQTLPTMDQTRKQARLEFHATSAELVGGEGQGWQTVAGLLDLAAVGLAAEQVGGADRCLDMATDYAKVRYQFGRPIGSFQAVKHKCADMLLMVESAKSAAYYAGKAAAAGAEDLPLAASLAKAYCSEAFTYTSAECIQIHGGIGFTWEHPAHLYFKRAKADELYLGDPIHHRAVLADRLGL
ncbi:acyl-CoA/acyl-ACP dehydrogenase [Haloechinothrix sp. YIM 98757]|uniref:Acyl-CoA/acyl-ACP dehydrogenase n=1 Tax=Haloechinothrix aidingensis TaxID=2752311 RepID=A0A838AC15_9PSEU|nr:acyl-CoA dehydrogenase family protein [Haloechinothrix aidingensis]MBA0126794.1 acyl-CoA/acyl-ACP dehydrogenase [Haloechinothrix aidingensis]